MLVIDTLRSTHAFLGRLRDMADFTTAFTSSPAKLQVSDANAAGSQTQTETTAQIPIDPRLLTVRTPVPAGRSTGPKICDRRTRRKRNRRCVFQPEAGSLYAILHEYAGESLFVRPFLWTNVHLAAFGVKFVTLPPCQRPRPVSSEGWKHQTPSSTSRRITSSLDLLLGLSRAPSRIPPACSASRMTGLTGIFELLYPGKKFCLVPGKNHSLPMFIWGTPYPHSCQVEGLWRDSEHRVTMGFIDKASLEYIRRHRTFSIGTPRRAAVENIAVKELVRKRVNLILPKDPDNDPYLVAAIIILAQNNFYPATPESKGLIKINRHKFRNGPTPRFHDIKVRVVTNDNTSQLSVYTATVTADVLRALHHPVDAPLRSGPEDYGLTIEHTKVDIWPVYGLRERLGKALGKDLVGDVDFDGMEMWEDPPDPDVEDSDTDTVAFSTIRRNTSGSTATRRVLSDISNDNADEESGSPAKKRRVSFDDSFIGADTLVVRRAAEDGKTTEF